MANYIFILNIVLLFFFLNFKTRDSCITRHENETSRKTALNRAQHNEAKSEHKTN